MVAEMVTLQAELKALAEQKRKAAYEEFVQGAWSGRAAMEMLTLANEAGMKAEDADKLIARIREGQAKVLLADQAARLRKEVEESKVRYGKLYDRNMKEVGRLNGEIRHAEHKHNVLFTEMCDAERAIGDLYRLKDEGLMPMSHKELTRRAEYYEVAERHDQAKKVRIAAFDAHYKLQERIKSLEYQIKHMPFTVTREYDMEQAKAFLVKANREIVEAAAKLKDAEADVERTKKEMEKSEKRP